VKEVPVPVAANRKKEGGLGQNFEKKRAPDIHKPPKRSGSNTRPSGEKEVPRREGTYITPH